MWLLLNETGGGASVASLCITTLSYISTTSNELGKLTRSLSFATKVLPSISVMTNKSGSALFCLKCLLLFIYFSPPVTLNIVLLYRESIWILFCRPSQLSALFRSRIVTQLKKGTF